MVRYILLHLFLLCSLPAAAQSTLVGKRICIDPGHGGTGATDKYRVGPNGEREEWINLRVALQLRDVLINRGATVFLTRKEDVQVDLTSRAQLARDSAADVFISIHHNATADRSVNFPIIYFHGAASENLAAVQLGRCFGLSITERLHKRRTPVCLVSDFTIFPERGAAVLRETYGIPALLCEASFFTNVKEERKLKKRRYNKKEALAYAEAIERFFSLEPHGIRKKQVPLEITPFPVLQEADRMKPEALSWLTDYKEGKKRMQHSDTASLRSAYQLFTRSARSFPDSYVARECHLYRSTILKMLNKNKEAELELKRAKEYYVNIYIDPPIERNPIFKTLLPITCHPPGRWYSHDK